MTLNEYLKSPGALSVGGLCAAIGAKSDAQIRQWQHGYADRLPSPANCVAIERATAGAVRRWDLRPRDWHLIWPELAQVKGSPEVPESETKAAA
jgi:DNA-binding transcriptional regulator YdaS (Cro superfamily)